MAMKEHLEQFIRKNTAGELNLQEQIALAEQMADPQNTDAEELMQDEWKSQFEANNYADRNFNAILDSIHHRIRLNEQDHSMRLGWWRTFQRIAAILIFPLFLAISIYVYLQSGPSLNNDAYAEIQCPMGVRTKFKLPDGTTGFLNSGSRLKYPVRFSGQRSVELIGEAYFDVVHNKKSPFHVNTRNLDIVVVGTSFNVLANENEKTEEIVLQTGKVVVADKNGDQFASLLPNDQLVLDIDNKSFTKKAIEATQYSSWKEGKLVFRNENMRQVATRLSRWYNAEVVVEDRLLDDYRFHATFIDEPLDEVLKLISITTPIRYREEARIKDQQGIYQQRKIILSINKNKINQFR
jgi:ferric-dicitrate binding protein FerR (iron transport regulator)